MNTSEISIEAFKTLIPTLIIEGLKHKLLSQDEVRQMFSPAISRMTLNRWMKSGLLPFYKVDAKIYFKYDEVLNACRVGNKMNKRLEHENATA